LVDVGDRPHDSIFMTFQPMQICLAPLRGLTGAVFRNSYAELFRGIDRAVAPFLTAIGGARIKPGQLKELLPENNTRMPVVPQILSKNADNFIFLSRVLHDLGYDTVNWNLGCPFPRVARKKRGSGLLPHPDLVDAFLEGVFSSSSVRISIKARLGRQGPDEIFALLPVFNRYPLEELILHPRTGVQMYTGRADLDTFEKCLPLCSCPLTYNGDIESKTDFDRLRMRFPTTTTWMIGRGVLRNPFLPAIIKGLNGDAVNWVERFRQFHDTLYERFAQVRHGPAHLVDSMKGYWNYFAASFAKGERVLKQVRKADTPKRYEQIVAHFFENEAHQHSLGAENR
jgi:tRNA-dihydrouridine synthase B